jgi:hypothetical protein
MNYATENDFVDLGAVSAETKGGPYGSGDFWGTLMTKDLGLSQD